MTEETNDSHPTDEGMSEVTPGGKVDQAPDSNQGRKRDAHEGQTHEKLTRVNPVQKQMRHEDQDIDRGGIQTTTDMKEDPKTPVMKSEDDMQKHNSDHPRPIPKTHSKSVRKMPSPMTLANRGGRIH